MSNVEKIQAAEAQVQQMQETLNSVQTGLERAESVAVAAEEAKQRSDTAVKAVAGALVVAVLLLLLSRRRR